MQLFMPHEVCSKNGISSQHILLPFGVINDDDDNLLGNGPHCNFLFSTYQRWVNIAYADIDMISIFLT